MGAILNRWSSFRNAKRRYDRFPGFFGLLGFVGTR